MSKRKDKHIKYWGNQKGRNYHHLKPYSRGGSGEQSNMLLIKEERHKKWHDVFENLTLDEVIKLLIRLRKAKGYEE